MAFRQSDAIGVKRTKSKGRGVFALRPIRKGEIIETCPVLVLPAEAVGTDDYTTGLHDYCFAWGRGTVALVLGYGSLYNHSYRPNARYDDLPPQTKTYTALRNISPGEEITINYNGDPSSRSKVWFDLAQEGSLNESSPKNSATNDGSRPKSKQPK